MAPTPLGHFLQSQLDARHELASDFAVRAGLGVSHVYQILRGERIDIRKGTLEKIAAGFGMTVAEMMATVEPRLTDDDPLVELIRVRTENVHLKSVINQMKGILATFTGPNHAGSVAIA